MIERVQNFFRLPTKSILMFGLYLTHRDSPRISSDAQRLGLELGDHEVEHRRVTTTPVKTEQMMPISRVTAKPRMGPDPYCSSTKAAMAVVSWASKIVQKARP